MIREPYIGMPIHIGAAPGNRPGDFTCGGSAVQPGPSQPGTSQSGPSQPGVSHPGSGNTGSGSGSTGSGSGNTGSGSGNTGSGSGNGQNPAGDCTIDNVCGRNYDARLLGSLPLAMTYTPMQQWKTTYSRDVALRVGTVFPELDLPFEGGMKK